MLRAVHHQSRGWYAAVKLSRALTSSSNASTHAIKLTTTPNRLPSHRLPSHRLPSHRRQHQQRTPFCTFVSKHFSLAPGAVDAYLRRYGIKHRYTAKETQVEECPFCPPTKGKHDNLYKLYIDRSNGVWFCHRCKKKGSWFQFRKVFSRGADVDAIDPAMHILQKRPNGDEIKTSERKPLPSTADQDAFCRNLWNEQNSAAKSYLNKERAFRDEVLQKYGVGFAHVDIMVGRKLERNSPCITFPMHDGNGTLVRHKIRPVETKSGMRLSPKGGNWGLFGLNTVPSSATSVVLTEGEYDAMSVYQATGRPAISLPNGASSLPLELLPYLERFDTIYLWMDEDEAGQTGAEQFCRKLGIKRCLSVRGIVRNQKACKDANDGLLKRLDLEHLIQRAEVVKHSAIVTFADLEDQVYAELTNASDPNAVRCQSIPRLHELMKGHRPGELTILSGPTGSGKTTLLSQMSLDFCVQNVSTLWGSFEMSNAKLARKLLTQFHSVYSAGSGTLVHEYEHWAERFRELPMYFMKYHGSNAVEEIIDAMEYANYVYDCRHVALDNLQFMSHGQKSWLHKSQFEVMDDAVGQLRNFCTSRNVHVSLVVHPRKTDDDEKIQISSVFGSAKATQEADNVLILQTTKDGRRLEVKKNRFDGSVGGIALKFDNKKLVFSQGDSVGGWLGWGDLSKLEGSEHSRGAYARKEDKEMGQKAEESVVETQDNGVTDADNSAKASDGLCHTQAGNTAKSECKQTGYRRRAKFRTSKR